MVNSLLFISILHSLLSLYADFNTIYVPAEFETIQQAIETARPGDLVLVGSGTYMENIDLLGKPITLLSEFGADNTVIDGGRQGNVITCMSEDKQDIVLIGFTLTNGRCGIYNTNCSLSVSQSIFHSNVGAITNIMGDLTVDNCKFKKNSGGIDIYYSELTATKSLFCDTACGIDGNDTVMTIIHCIFENNEYGGIKAWGYPMDVSYCTFLNNSENGGFGGGIDYTGYYGSITNCIFVNNSAKRKGGGIACHLVYDGYGALVANCTFYNNSAEENGAIISSGEVTNCILWDNGIDPISAEHVTYCCIEGGYAGTGNIKSDPLFVDPVHYDFHLTYPSPCRDAGTNAKVSYTYDIEGDPRVAWNGIVDMGADEFYNHLYVTSDQTHSGINRANIVGLPGTSPISLFIAPEVYKDPLSTAYELFRKEINWQPITVSPIPATGVFSLGAVIRSYPLVPYNFQIRALIGQYPDSFTNIEIINVQ